MNKHSTSLATLLERMESEIETANGRTVRLCRDPNGNYWVVDGAERVVSLGEFAAECHIAAREFCAQARAELFRRSITRAKEAFVRIVKGVQKPGAKTAHA
jgi:hypothetical protein